MLVSGPTMCGKTQWVKKLIDHREDMIHPPPEKVIYSYQKWQPAYETLMNDVHFIKGMDIDTDGYLADY